MIYAQILSGVIMNVIVLNNPKLIPAFKKLDAHRNYDCVVRIDNVKPQPSIGWGATCKGKFTSPKK